MYTKSLCLLFIFKDDGGLERVHKFTMMCVILDLRRAITTHNVSYSCPILSDSGTRSLKRAKR